MDKAEFDKFATEYRELHAENIRISGESPEFFAEYKVRDVYNLLAARRHPARRILDFGAGVGNSVPHFRRFFPGASLICFDVSEESLRIAASRFPGEAQFRIFHTLPLPLPDESVDIAFAACVFHHISGNEHSALLNDLRRVLRTGGHMIVFEHNPWNPLTVHAVNTCPFDENAVLINGPRMRKTVEHVGFQQVQLRYRLFFPSALRALRPLEGLLSRLPLGAQYMVAGVK